MAEYKIQIQGQQNWKKVQKFGTSDVGIPPSILTSQTPKYSYKKLAQYSTI
jgi:hypothetical protein